MSERVGEDSMKLLLINMKRDIARFEREDPSNTAGDYLPLANRISERGENIRKLAARIAAAERV